MPTYEYQCQHCHERLEAVQAFSDAPLTVCPQCGGELRKVFSAVGIVFKGSGFYKNDSRPTSTKSATSASPSSEATKSTSEPAAASTPSTATAPSTSPASSTSSND